MLSVLPIALYRVSSSKYMVLGNHSNTAAMRDIGIGWLHQPITPEVMEKVLLSLLGDPSTKLFWKPPLVSQHTPRKSHLLTLESEAAMLCLPQVCHQPLGYCAWLCFLLSHHPGCPAQPVSPPSMPSPQRLHVLCLEHSFFRCSRGSVLYFLQVSAYT